jgi:hypothetical protein
MDRSKRSKFARVLATLALPVTTATLTGYANADGCTPAAPVDNTTVTCTGTTTNQNDPNGYGTGVETGNTINVQTGATVTGTQRGLLIDSGTVINNGSITASGNSLTRGISANSNVTVTNVGTISLADVLGVTGVGILAQGVTTVNNQGTISLGSNAFGAGSNLGEVDLTNSGTISAGANGGGVLSNSSADVTNSGLIQATAGGIGISAASGATLDNTATGVISVGAFGVTTNAIANVKNAGTIQANDVDGRAINASTVNVSRNTGALSATNIFAIAINATGNASVNNDTGGTISGSFAGVQAGGTTTVNNAQGALIEATEPSFNSVAISGAGVSVQNSGTIRALGASGAAIVAGDGGLTLNNASAGAITGTRSAISSRGILTVTGNEGLIESNSSNSFAIVGQSDVSVSNGTIGSIRAFGQNSLAIASNANVMVENGGGSIHTFDQGSTTVFGNNVRITSNTGLIGASGLNAIAIRANSTAEVTNNSGGIIESRANNGIAIASDRTATVENGGGLIQTLGQDSTTISATNVKITGNAGTIEASGLNGVAVRATDTADVTNSGTIRSTGDGGDAVRAGNVLINNSAGGTIVGNTGAIAMGTGVINNAGTLSITKPNNANRTVVIGISATVNNSGTILAPSGSFAIDARRASLDLVNSGTIDAGSNSIMAETASIQNFGSISNSGSLASENIAISFKNGVVGNLGTIQAVGIGVDVENGTVSNSGSISGATGIRSLMSAMISNSGTIQGIGPAGVSVFANNGANVFNIGNISGSIGIQANGRDNAGTVITNAGTVAGNGGTAIKLSPAADTLTLLPGSKIIGVVDMGGGADTINVIGAAAVTTRVSSLFKALAASLPDLINFTGIINTINSFVTPNGMPTVQSGNSVATLDPTAFGRADRALMSFTGGISSLVQGRLGGTAANGSGVQVVSFAPTGASGRTEQAFAAMSAIRYAAERTRPPAHAFTYADAPYNVWTSGFGGASTQKGDNMMLRSIASAGAGVIGLDRQVRPDLLIGAFAGGGAGRLSVELNSQSVDTDYVTGGVYGRFDWINHFLDFTVQGGATINKSKRLVLNNSVPAGSETATASYDGWYISPEVAYGRRYQFANGYTLTPVGRIRYLAGTFDGYNEAGSAQNLVVGRRTLHDLEERAEVELAKITGIGVGSFRTNVHGGFIALQRLGNPTINTVLIGQDLSFATPGKASTAGAVAGAGFDFRATDRVSLFGAFEATLMSDHTRTAAAKAGLKLAF